MLGNEAHLARGRSGFVGDQFGRNRRQLAERLAEFGAGLVAADQADENALGAQRRDVARDIAGAADLDRVAVTLSTGVGASGEMRVTSP